MFQITMLPAEDGDCLLVEFGSEKSPFRMLIDGGRTSTNSELSKTLAALPVRAGPTLDVMVLTHVDADHIEGLLELLGDKSAPEIGDVWFNGGDHLATAAGRTVVPKPPRHKRPRTEPPEKVLSILQGINFSELIEADGRRWNDAFKGGPLMIDGPELPKIPVGDGILTLLGPPKEKLAVFQPEWAKKVKELAAKAIPTLKGRKRPTPTVQNIPMLATQLNTPDSAKPNGTSIAFVIEYDKRRVLFTADAHPDDIAGALKIYQPGKDRVHFDAIKVAHHGSARNNTSQLVDLLDSPRWLVSTSGAHHEHPDPEAIARIVLAPSKGKTLAFNYRSDFNVDWDDPAIKQKYEYRVCYPDKNGQALFIDLK